MSDVDFHAKQGLQHVWENQLPVLPDADVSRGGSGQR